MTPGMWIENWKASVSLKVSTCGRQNLKIIPNNPCPCILPFPWVCMEPVNIMKFCSHDYITLHIKCERIFSDKIKFIISGFWLNKKRYYTGWAWPNQMSPLKEGLEHSLSSERFFCWRWKRNWCSKKIFYYAFHNHVYALYYAISSL